jgi:hypothetical protein
MAVCHLDWQSGEADDDFGGATDGYLYGDRLGLLDCVLLGEAKDGVDRGYSWAPVRHFVF